MNDKNENNKEQDDNGGSSYIGYGVSFGLLGGAAFSTIIGAIFEFPLIWTFGPGIGLLIGIVTGAIMDSNKNNS